MYILYICIYIYIYLPGTICLAPFLLQAKSPLGTATRGTSSRSRSSSCRFIVTFEFSSLQVLNPIDIACFDRSVLMSNEHKLAISTTIDRQLSPRAHSFRNTAGVTPGAVYDSRA